MGVTFQVENAATFERECWPLFLEHFQEVALDQERMKLEPDVSYYRFLESRGQLLILTARKDGVLIGYQITVIRPHPHYIGSLCGFEDLYFLTQTERKGWTGVRLIKESLIRLKQRKVKKVFFHSKCHLALDAIFNRLGFTHCDNVWSKWIGD